METPASLPAPGLTRLSNESSLTNPFDWLLLLGFPPEAAGRSLGLAGPSNGAPTDGTSHPPPP